MPENTCRPIFALPKKAVYPDLHVGGVGGSKIEIEYWEFSSAGSEHPDLHVGRVGGSKIEIEYWEFSSAGSEHLPYKQRVGGSIPSTPTQYRQGFQRKTETPFYLAGLNMV